MKNIFLSGICLLVLFNQETASGQIRGFRTGNWRVGASIEKQKGVNDPIGQSVDFSTGFELTVQFSGQYNKEVESFVYVEMNVLRNDGSEYHKYTNFVYAAAGEDSSTIRTSLECEINFPLFEMMRSKGTSYKINVFDSKIHTLTIRERRVSDMRYIVLHYLDDKLVGSYDLDSGDRSNIGSSDLVLSNKGNFKIGGIGNTHIVGHKYRKLDNEKRYFITFAGTDYPHISGKKVAYRTENEKVVERSTQDFKSYVGGYMQVQWTVLDGRQTYVESWGYWPDEESNIINIGKLTAPLWTKYLGDEGTSVFRCEVTEGDYLSSIVRRNQLMKAPKVYDFTKKRCVSFITGIASGLINSVYDISGFENQQLIPSEFIGTYLSIPYAEQNLELEEMYYPLSNNDFTPTTTAVPNVNVSESNEKLLTKGTWVGNGAAHMKFKGGQMMHFKVKNTNVIPTQITINCNLCNLDQNQSLYILPLATADIKFSIFGNEPIDWTFDISSDSKNFAVTWELYSTWVPNR